LSISTDTWNSTDTYAVGDIVSPQSSGYIGSDPITSAGWKLTFRANSGQENHAITVNVADATRYPAGSSVTIRDLEVASAQVGYTWYDNNRNPVRAGDIVSGSFSVISVESSTQIVINRKIISSSGGVNIIFIGNQGFIEEDIPITDGTAPFFRSLQDSNKNKSLASTDWWEKVYYLNGALNCQANEDLFSIGDVGRELSIKTSKNNTISGSWTSNQSSVAINAYGSVEMIAEGGVWDGTLTLELSIDYGETWAALRTITSSEGSSNGSIEVDIPKIESLVRVTLSDWTNFTGSTKLKFRVELKDDVKHHVRIVEYVDARNVVVETINPLLNPVDDYRYALGEFSVKTGYPHSLTIHDERLCLGGSLSKPNTVFASRVNDWSNYTKGSTETSPYTFTIASDSFDTIRSLKSSRQLNVLTDNAENTMGSRDDNAITSITNISVSSHTNYGSNETQAIQLADMIWFVMGQGERVRASRYDFASDGQQSIEMSLFASHITKSGIKEMSFRRHPFNSLFCLLNNGTGAVLTYEGMQEVKAWATVKTEGNIISAASNYSDTGDIIAGVVERNGSYFLEQFGDVDDGTVFLDNQTTWTDANFDLGQPIEQDDDGNLVVILDDTELVRDVDYTIAGGVLTIPSQLTGDVCIGRRIECRVNPTDISEVAPSGMVKRLTELGLYLLDSGTCNVEINGKPSPFSDGLKWVAGQRESGLFELTTGGDYEQGLDVNITIDGHRHFTLTGLGYRLGISQG
jgi:hypothetical protein